MENQNIPWIEKYRPMSLDDIKGNAAVLNIFRKYISDKKLPNTLFYGPSGTGKTSVALLCAKSLYGLRWNSMVLQINASDEKSGDNLRKRIHQFATFQNLFQDKNKKLVFIDEVDSMSDDIQIVLCDMISSLSHLLFFFFAGNNQYSLQTRLLSRLVCILFPPVSFEDTLLTIQQISEKETTMLTYDIGGVRRLYALVGGDLRKTINTIQAISLSSGRVTETSVNLVLLNTLRVEIEEFLEFLQDHTIRESIRYLEVHLSATSQDFIEWMRFVFEHIFIKDEKENTANHLVEYSASMANIEHNASFMVDFQIQLYSFVMLTHKYLKRKRLKGHNEHKEAMSDTHRGRRKKKMKDVETL